MGSVRCSDILHNSAVPLSSCRYFVNSFNQSAQHVRVGGSQHAMSQVKDMSRAIIGAPQHIEHALRDRIPGGQEQGRVEGDLDAQGEADTLPGLLQGNAPIDPDYIPAS